MAQQDPETDLALGQGMHAPESAMRLQIQQAIEEAMVTQGSYVMEGFPRTIAQWICLLQWGAAVPQCFLVDTPEMVCISRTVARQRSDDSPDALARRLQSFKEKTQPLVDLLEDAGILEIIDGLAQTADQVLEVQMKGSIKQHGRT
jgi:adenylate kinase family enzyme